MTSNGIVQKLWNYCEAAHATFALAGSARIVEAGATL